MAGGDTPIGSEEQSDTEFKRIVQALGLSVLAWSQVERGVETLVSCLFRRHGLRYDVARPVAANLDIREKCQIALAMAFQAELSKPHLQKITSLLNTVQTDLRNRRNRLLHDSWSVQRQGVMKRLSTGTRITRPQAHQLALAIPDFEKVSLSEIKAFRDACMTIFDAVMAEATHVIDCWEASMKR